MIFLGLEEYFAGDVAIVEGRELITSVTLKTLIHDMNSTDQGYCFIRVLVPEDRFPFVKVLPPSLIVDIYRRRSIKLGTWVRVMNAINLSRNYIAYRRGYWGENTGRRILSPRLTDHVIPMWYFSKGSRLLTQAASSESSRPTASSASRPISFLGRVADMLGIVLLEEPATRILLHENHMERFHFGKWKKSNWDQKEFHLPDEYYGVRHTPLCSAVS
jgi:hypothetical protein